MRLRAISSTPATTEVDVLAVPIYRDEGDLDGELADLDRASGGAIRAAIDWGEFNPRRARLRPRRRGDAARPDGCSSSTPERGAAARGAHAGWRPSRRGG